MEKLSELYLSAPRHPFLQRFLAELNGSDKIAGIAAHAECGAQQAQRDRLGLRVAFAPRDLDSFLSADHRFVGSFGP